MAGMDWFRWHHGSVTDPKFQLVARKSGASLPDVLAVWAYILETASQSVERGDFGSVDCEALDCLFGFPATETRTAAILEAMQSRDLVDGSRVKAWEKRQPKREREDATSADRKASSRANKNHVTPCHTGSHQKKPREEESREEISTTDVVDGRAPRKRSAPHPEMPRPGDVDPQTWADWVQHRKVKKATVTPTVVESARGEAAKAGMTLDAFFRAWCAHGSQGMLAEWLRPHERAGPASESFRERDARIAAERVAAFAPGVADRSRIPTTIIDSEQSSVIAIESR